MAGTAEADSAPEGAARAAGLLRIHEGSGEELP
jgi:hypothetical protein